MRMVYDMDWAGMTSVGVQIGWFWVLIIRVSDTCVIDIYFLMASDKYIYFEAEGLIR